ncbi:MAG: superoxide dismutase [Candidatus Komeilibacteria bacterium]
MIYELPKLKFSYEALEPFIDAQTMEIHHSKHHQTYVNKLNEALAKHPELSDKTLESMLRDLTIVPEDIRTAVKNHGGGHWNHSFFWQVIGPKSQAPSSGDFYSAIDRDFGSLDKFKEQFTAAATAQFGSGWTWLVSDSSGKLSVVSLPNQDSPLAQGLKPLLVIDIWEHAYYLKYQNRRAEYISAWWNVVDWVKVQENFKK